LEKEVFKILYDIHKRFIISDLWGERLNDINNGVPRKEHTHQQHVVIIEKKENTKNVLFSKILSKLNQKKKIYEIGSKVCFDIFILKVKYKNFIGTIQYIGKIKNKDGDWVGIEWVFFLFFYFKGN
jgi:hypothetical protein